MKIVKNDARSLLMIDDTWDIDVSYASNTITMNIKMSYSNIVYINAASTIDLTKLTPKPDDFTAYTMLTDVNPEGLWTYCASQELNPTPNVVTSSYVVDLFRMTLPSKLNVDDFIDMHDKLLFGALLVPFSDSTPDDMVFMVRAPYNVKSNITYSGFSQELPMIEKNGYIKYLPSLKSNAISMANNSTQSFDIQLTDGSGNNISKPNVMIYLENTGGLLTNSRIVTDNRGIATGHVTSLDSSFKIKAGFKYFSGGWSGDTNNAFTASGRNSTQNQYFDFTAKLLNWRKNKSVIHTGKTTHYVPENNVYVYFRYNDSESVMVIINNNKEKQTFKTNRFQENILNYKTGKDILTSSNFDLSNDISIEGKSVLILELK